jgi:predicted nucleic acid-binding protein
VWRLVATVALASLQGLGVEIWPVAPAQCLDVALRHELAVYDSAYLALAADLRATFGSLDERLRAAARLSGVAVEP